MFEAQIAKGVALLDHTRPGWRESVDLGTLNLSQADHCVLGQVFSGYYTGLKRLDITTSNEVVDHGFSVKYRTGSPRKDFAKLTTEWIEALSDDR